MNFSSQNCIAFTLVVLTYIDLFYCNFKNLLKPYLNEFSITKFVIAEHILPSKYIQFIYIVYLRIFSFLVIETTLIEQNNTATHKTTL